MAAAWIRFIASAVLLTIAATALEAGGWAVITVIDLPDEVIVGRPVTLTYAVRQHGMRLLDGLSGRIEARGGADVLRAAAVPAPEPGHYSATLMLPYAGEWTVDIVSGFAGSLNSSRITLRAIDARRPAAALSDVERGRRLFVAKGCITCHVHAAIEGRSTSVGPVLSSKRYQPKDLGRYLAHPPQTEPFEPGRWQMPNLKLHDRDIASLVAFLTTERRHAERR